MKPTLDKRRCERIGRAILKYGKIDVTKQDLLFYSYTRDERGNSESYDFAWYDPDDGSLNVEVPSIDKIKDRACLAFLFLHELAHADGVKGEVAATNLAVESLIEANVLSRRRIEKMKEGWKLARYDKKAVGRELEKLLKRRRTPSKEIPFAVMSDLYDKARIALLCGRAR